MGLDVHAEGDTQAVFGHLQGLFPGPSARVGPVYVGEGHGVGFSPTRSLLFLVAHDTARIDIAHDLQLPSVDM